MITDMLYHSFQIVVIAVSSLLIALALMPNQAFDIVVLGEVRQTVINLTLKGFQQRLTAVTG